MRSGFISVGKFLVKTIGWDPDPMQENLFQLNQEVVCFQCIGSLSCIINHEQSYFGLGAPGAPLFIQYVDSKF